MKDAIRLLSFDLQGTLSDSAFSDDFWLRLLPELYAQAKNLSLDEAKQQLRAKFKEAGKYHRLYYCAKDWLDELLPDTSVVQVCARLSPRPHLFEDTLSLVKELSAGGIPLVILSATTHDFIEIELADESRHFKQVYSTLDDFEIPGKPKMAFEEAARRMGVSPAEILHVGDCSEMDIANAEEAGCKTFFFDKRCPREEVVVQLQTVLNRLL
jgi:putative hydrolase of the HAD superfamily